MTRVEVLSDAEAVARYRDPWEPEDVSASTIRAKVREEVASNFQYVVHEAASEREYHNGIRDKGRGPVRLDHFASHPIATEAELSEAHVIALRYYSELCPSLPTRSLMHSQAPAILSAFAAAAFSNARLQVPEQPAALRARVL